jgi:Ca-activated chloride channel family protein
VNFLGPIPSQLMLYAAIGAGALAVIAYILKMRRRRFEVPFSALWRRVLEQRDANALWKQLKRWMSLLIALLVLGLILAAALDPTLGGAPRDARSVVVLIDASASMKASDGADSDDAPAIPRMEAAKRRARELVDSMGGSDVAMIMRVDGQATPLSRFTSDAPRLRKVIDEIKPSDAPADLTRALGAAADALRDRKNPLIVIVSDGAFPEAQLGLATWGEPPAAAGSGSATPTPAADGSAASSKPSWQDKNLAAVDLTGIDVRYLPVGRRTDNVGIVAFNVRRYVANKAAYEVLIEIENFSDIPAKRQLALYNGTTAVDVRPIDLAPGQRLRQIYKELPGSDDSRLRASLRPVEVAAGGLGGADPFALDDEAYALLPARRKQKVLMVIPDTVSCPPGVAVGAPGCESTQGNLFLEGALMIDEDNIEPWRVTPEEFEAKPAMAADYDAVVFDEYTPKELPPPPTSLIFFHPTGPSSPFAIRGEVQKPRVTEIEEAHPVMRWVGLSDVYIDKSNAFAIDRAKGETYLALSVRDPIIAAKREGGRKMVAFGFSLPGPGRDSATDLPLRVAFPLLLINCFDWFAGDEGDLMTTYVTGTRQRIPLDGVIGSTEAEVVNPDTSLGKAPIVDGVATFYTQQVGFHELRVRAPAEVAADAPVIAAMNVAANLGNPTESDIAPSTVLTLAGKELQAPEAFAVTRTKKLWIYAALLVVLILLVEWATYHRRITV